MSAERTIGSKRVVLIRHAKSSWRDTALADHDRPLNKRGRESLPRLCDHLRGLGLHVDLVLCSTARRTRETYDGIAAALRARVKFEPAIYEAGATRLLNVLRGLNEQIDTVVLIGHNPGIADLVELLRDDDVDGGASREGVPATIEKFPTAAVAVLEMTVRWRDLDPAGAELQSFWTPRAPDDR